MCNIVIESNVIDCVSNLIKNEYLGKRTGLIISSRDIKKYKRQLSGLKGLNVEVYIYNMSICNDAVIDEFCANMAGIECVIGFGCDNLIDLAKMVAYKLNSELYIILTDMITLSVTGEYCRVANIDNLVQKVECNSPIVVYVDIDILSKLSSRNVANGFAYLLSNNLLVCKMLYENIDDKKINCFDELLKQTNHFTATNILSLDGRIKLIKLLFELSIFADKYNLNMSFNNLINIYDQYYTKKLLIGEKLVIFTMLILSLHEKVVSGEIGVEQLDITKRLHRLHKLFHNEEYENKMMDSISKNASEIINLNKEKSRYLKWLNKAISRVGNNMALLKRIYVDKGIVFYNINMSQYINSLSLIADMVEDKIFTVLRDVGVLDNI